MSLTLLPPRKQREIEQHPAASVGVLCCLSVVSVWATRILAPASTSARPATLAEVKMVQERSALVEQGRPERFLTVAPVPGDGTSAPRTVSNPAYSQFAQAGSVGSGIGAGEGTRGGHRRRVASPDRDPRPGQ